MATTTSSSGGVGGSAAGGRGRDLIDGRLGSASLFGGPGSDTILSSIADTPGRVIDGGSDGDTVTIVTTLTTATTTIVPVPDVEPKLRISEGTATADVENAEKLLVEGGLNNEIPVGRYDITMLAPTSIRLSPWQLNAPLTVRVPGGTYTQGTNSISAPGLRTVSWTTPVTLTVVPA